MLSLHYSYLPIHKDSVFLDNHLVFAELGDLHSATECLLLMSSGMKTQTLREVSGYDLQKFLTYLYLLAPYEST